jgi:hypothetical protein
MSLEGHVKNGRIVLNTPADLPDGTRVRVEIVAQPAAPAGPDWWHVLQQIRADREARGYPFRSGEEIDAELAAMRDEWEERQLALERLQEESGRERDRTANTPGASG